MSDRSLKTILLACLVLVLALLTAQVRGIAQDYHAERAQAASSATETGEIGVDIVPYPENWSELPDCPQEDSWTVEDCKWDAGTAGNGSGHSFYGRNGEIFYVS